MWNTLKTPTTDHSTDIHSHIEYTRSNVVMKKTPLLKDEEFPYTFWKKRKALAHEIANDDIKIKPRNNNQTHSHWIFVFNFVLEHF